MLLLENHWGLTTTAEGMVRVLEGVNSPWLRAILDMGNFYYDGDMYTAMERIAPYVDLAHAKTYPGGGLVFTIDIDYARVFRILKGAGFQGYVSIEMEGQRARGDGSAEGCCGAKGGVGANLSAKATS